jgi:hypothetical protein
MIVAKNSPAGHLQSHFTGKKGKKSNRFINPVFRIKISGTGIFIQPLENQ